MYFFLSYPAAVIYSRILTVCQEICQYLVSRVHVLFPLRVALSGVLLFTVPIKGFRWGAIFGVRAYGASFASFRKS